MSVSTSLITVIDFDCDLDGWVREVDADLWNAAISEQRHSRTRRSRRPSASPAPEFKYDDVMLFTREEHGINCYMRDLTDIWHTAHIGSYDWNFSWCCEPEGAQSKDDFYSGGVSFSRHAELMSFIARGGPDAYEDEHTFVTYERITNPYCVMPQFWWFRDTELCPDRYTWVREETPLRDIYWTLWTMFRNLIWVFQEHEDEYGYTSRPAWDFIRSFWTCNHYRYWMPWPFNGFGSRYVAHYGRYCDGDTPEVCYNTLSDPMRYMTEEEYMERYRQDVRFNSGAWRSHPFASVF
jgi:hypothetical protein